MSSLMRISVAVACIAVLGGCGAADDFEPVTEEDAPDLPFRSITAGDRHACARVGGEIYCWGFYGDKRLGEKRNNLAAKPIEVPNVEALDLAAGQAHTCAGELFSPNGGAGCWGNGKYGQLGRGLQTRTPTGRLDDFSKEAKSQPDPDLNGARVVDVAAGARHSCAVLRRGDVKCWGDDSQGQVGDGFPPSGGKKAGEAIEKSPQLVRRIGAQGDPDRTDEGALGPAIDVSAGAGNTCALLENGEVYCWGSALAGQLGNGVAADVIKNSPVQVQGIDNATDISVGFLHSCATLENGEAKCWGEGSEGKLGDGTTMNRATPVTVKNLGDGAPIDISAGKDHTCAVVLVRSLNPPERETQVRCWGSNLSGQLGHGRPDDFRSPTPVKVVEITNAAGVAVGDQFSCALIGASDSEEIKCWGAGGEGQLGDGRRSSTTGPFQRVSIPGSP